MSRGDFLDFRGIAMGDASELINGRSFLSTRRAGCGIISGLGVTEKMVDGCFLILLGFDLVYSESGFLDGGL